jgi:hypothetical protein
MGKQQTQDVAELAACTPETVNPDWFNLATVLPYGLTIEYIQRTMTEFLDLLCFLNYQLRSKSYPRLERLLKLATFSGFVGEFMVSGIPKHCLGLVENLYHNGHPDLIPAGVFPNDEVEHGDTGVEVKGSRNKSGWQGHNAENAWLMVFVCDANGYNDDRKAVPPRPFQFVKVVGAQLVEEDWSFSGRSPTSRRTNTATVKKSGRLKMEANWIYKTPEPPKTAKLSGKRRGTPRSLP